MPEGSRPREKLIGFGAKSLSDSELLAIVIKTGNKKENVLSLSNRILNEFDIGKLSRISVSRLRKVFGVGDAKACQIAACFEIGRRLAKFRNGKEIIRNAKDVSKILMEDLRNLKKEQFTGIYLDSKNKIIKIENLFIGSLNESVVHPREIFKTALEESAASLILVHNHPSGDPKPSEEDLLVTKELTEGGDILGINVLDHVIIGDGKYFSFKEKGVI